jgi:hypothetical protein
MPSGPVSAFWHPFADMSAVAGHDLVTEGFRPGQVGSSAMPHKMNSRSCERVNGFAVLLRGYLTMVADLSGSQWNEGDVFCSVVRRVALPPTSAGNGIMPCRSAAASASCPSVATGATAPRARAASACAPRAPP